MQNKSEVCLEHHYERLRQGAQTRLGAGRALLMHKGMAAWMEAISRAVPVPSQQPPRAGCSKETMPPEASPIEGVLPAVAQEQVVGVLAQMAWEVCRRSMR